MTPKPGSPLHNLPKTPSADPKPPKFKKGEVFEKLTIVSYMGFSFGDQFFKKHRYLTQCTCGNLRVVTQSFLQNKKSVLSCKPCWYAQRKIHFQQLKQEKKVFKNKDMSNLSIKDVATLKW